MRCLALRPPAIDPQVESALNLGQTVQVDVGHAINLGPTLLVDVGHATVLVACRNVATRTAGGHTSVPTPYLWALPLEAKHSLLVGVSIGDAALRQQCVTCPTGQEHPDASNWSGNLAWRRTPIRVARASTLIQLHSHPLEGDLASHLSGLPPLAPR